MIMIWIKYLIKILSKLAKTIITSSRDASLPKLELVLSFCQTSANNLAETTVSEPTGNSGAKYMSLTPFP